MSDKATLTATQAPAPLEQVRVFDANAPQFRELGICATCNHRAGCLYLKSARRPVAFCEEFDDSGASKAAGCPATAARPPVNYGEAQTSGICSSCEGRSECVYRQPGVAIWDCGDYR